MLLLITAWVNQIELGRGQPADPLWFPDHMLKFKHEEFLDGWSEDFQKSALRCPETHGTEP